MHSFEDRRTKKDDIAKSMIHIYCRGNHKNSGTNQLCDECNQLLEYSSFRSSKCPHIERTLYCSNCPTPCYKPDMKEQMRVVMKYAGPRFLFKHPIQFTKHVIYDYKTRKRDEQ